MSSRFRVLVAATFLNGAWLALIPLGSVLAQSLPSETDAGSSEKRAKPSDTPNDAVKILTINVLEGLHSGQIAAEAEGLGDGRMSLSLTNRTKRQLRVVLPPGLIASGATGQFGGYGGMGGGFGGMGGMGMGGMGGMGMGMGGSMGGMGGLGGMGGMGGMGGGIGGMSGLGGLGMGGGTMPASMGMMMLGRLIMLAHWRPR